MTLFEQAICFATEAHKGVVRRYTNEPYIFHPLRVAMRVAAIHSDDIVRAAAVLHDVVEDTEVIIEEIAERFGVCVAHLVYYLTEPKHKPGLNRKIRKRLANEHFIGAPVEAMDIKLADVEDNVPSIIQHDPDFAPVYLAEKKQLLLYLLNGNAELRERVTTLLYNQ